MTRMTRVSPWHQCLTILHINSKMAWLQLTVNAVFTKIVTMDVSINRSKLTWRTFWIMGWMNYEECHVAIWKYWTELKMPYVLVTGSVDSRDSTKLESKERDHETATSCSCQNCWEAVSSCFLFYIIVTNKRTI